MGREVKMVPPNWEHPKLNVFRPFPNMRYESEYVPMYDRSLEKAWLDWQAEYAKWVDVGHDEVIAEMAESGRAGEYPKSEPYRSFCKWHGPPPNPHRYRPEWRDEDRTWYQVWSTVSEGTPVTPPFATEGELIDYLTTRGDFRDRAEAERFVKGRWAPSMVVTATPAGSTVEFPRDVGLFKGEDDAE
jgi:hypothetical protein